VEGLTRSFFCLGFGGGFKNFFFFFFFFFWWGVFGFSSRNLRYLFWIFDCVEAMIYKTSIEDLRLVLDSRSKNRILRVR
jgi:hypothetical protein